MKNILLYNKRYFSGGGNDGIIRSSYQTNLPTSQFSNIDLNNSNFSNLSKLEDINLDDNENNKTLNAVAKINPYASAAKSAIDIGIGSYKKGASNFDKTKAKSALNILQENERQANNVLHSYSAGQTGLDTIRKYDSGISSQKDLKNGSDAKNIGLSTARGIGQGAAAGFALGSVVPGIGNAVGTAGGAIIGGTIGLMSSAIGAMTGKNKREKERKKISNAQSSQDFAVDYHNWQQQEQLASANDNAAQIQNNQTRKNVLSLVAFGGRLKRKNYLLDNGYIV